jgi:hypothetical protein
VQPERVELLLHRLQLRLILRVQLVRVELRLRPLIPPQHSEPVALLLRPLILLLVITLALVLTGLLISVRATACQIFLRSATTSIWYAGQTAIFLIPAFISMVVQTLALRQALRLRLRSARILTVRALYKALAPATTTLLIASIRL